MISTISTAPPTELLSAMTLSAASLAKDETLLDIVFENSEFDTVDLFLQISPVCSTWRDASTRYLLAKKAPVYTEGSSDITITTREEFIAKWKNEQETFWKAHAAAHPARPRDCLMAFMAAQGNAAEDDLSSKLQAEALQRYMSVPGAVAPYLLVNAEHCLERHLRENLEFDETQFSYFLRVGRGSHGSDWHGMVPLKSVWRPSGDAVDDKEDETEEEKASAFTMYQNAMAETGGRNIDADIITNLLMFGNGKDKSCLPPGEAIQLRFDISSLPWTKDEFSTMKRQNMQPFPHVGLVAISKSTGEAHLIHADKSLATWNGNVGDSKARREYPSDCMTIMTITSKAESDEIESAELTMLVTKKAFEEYLFAGEEESGDEDEDA